MACPRPSSLLRRLALAMSLLAGPALAQTAPDPPPPPPSGDCGCGVPASPRGPR